METIEYLKLALKDAQDGREANRQDNTERARYWAILATELEKMIAFYMWYIDLQDVVEGCAGN